METHLHGLIEKWMPAKLYFAYVCFLCKFFFFLFEKWKCLLKKNKIEAEFSTPLKTSSFERCFEFAFFFSCPCFLKSCQFLYFFFFSFFMQKIYILGYIKCILTCTETGLFVHKYLISFFPPIETSSVFHIGIKKI